MRATVLGTHRNADLVLPTDQPLAGLVPPLLDLLGEPRTLGRHDVVTTTGEVLDPEQRLSQASLVDGVELRLVASSETPPAPLVYDMVEVAEDSAPRGRWSPTSRRWVFSVLGCLLLGAAVLLAAGVGTTPGLVLGVAVGAATAASAGVSRVALEPAWGLGGLALALAAGWLVLGSEPPGSDLGWWGGAGLLAIAVVGWCTRSLVPAVLAAGVLVGGGAVAVVAGVLTGSELLTAAVVSTAALLVLGLMPRLALSASGIFGSDAAVVAGREVLARDADVSLARAHHTLLGGVAALAVVAGVGSHRVALDAGSEVWPTTLAALLAAALVLRARHFPLALQRASLWGASAAGPITLAVSFSQDRPELAWTTPGVLALAGIVLVAVGLVRPGDVLAARGRRVATRVEGLVVVALLPVLVGCFDVYGDLLDSFG